MEIHHESHDIMMAIRTTVCGKGSEYFHWHENIEIIKPLTDGFSILIDGVMHKTKKGDIIFIGERCVHCFIIERDDTKIILGQFSPSVLMGAWADLKPVKTHIRAEEIESDEVFSQQINDLLKIMERVKKLRYSEGDYFSRSIFSAFYFAMMSKFPDTEHSKSTKKEKQDFYKIIDFINLHIRENITVQSIAKSLFMDRGKVSKLFVKYTGETIAFYINRLRIDNVNKLLNEGVSITQAAMECGFESMRTFNNIYRKIMGATPSEYIKNSKT